MSHTHPILQTPHDSHGGHAFHGAHHPPKVLDADVHVPNPDFDPSDPHGIHADDAHGHVIVSGRMLMSVLVILLVFTVMTVFLSRAEGWVATAFDVKLPDWLNVAVAMSIATVKALLVALFFMQLKYDNKLYMLIMAFCFLGVGIFLGATAGDLFSRDRLYRFKEGEIVAGGTGGQGLTRKNFVGAEGQFQTEEGTDKIVKEQIDKPIWLFAKTDETTPITPEAIEAIEAAHHADHEEALNTANRSRPMVGPRIFAPAAGHGADGGH